MPEIPIDPTTQRKIRAFGRRRRVFAGIRGGLVMLAVLLGAFFLIALIDWLTVMPNGLRALLTMAGYLGAGLTAWFCGIRDCFRPTTDAELARFMESAAPELREELLSAVELADFDPVTVRDSAEFRQLVQDSVAERVADVRPRELLPWARLKSFAIAAGSGLALVAILTLIVGIGFASRLMLRAAIPGSNMAKITGVEIEILEPAPASLITRAGDPVNLRFRVSKPEVRVANLTLATEGRKNTAQLRPVEPGIFETTLHPNRAPIDYQLAAGDAVTATHQIDPHTPPVILDFNKRYEFPSYLSRQTQEIRERDGHLKAIEGTTVTLEVKTDQPAVGEVRLTMGGETTTIPLSDSRMEDRGMESESEKNSIVPHSAVKTAQFQLTDSGRYQIHLIGARSKLPAEFAPTYQITAHPDKAPRIRLIKPDTARVVQPDAVIPVQAQAEDDFGIARVEQWLSRNGGEDWEQLPIVSKPGRQTPIAFNWDLLKHNLDAGDLITTKLVAFDGRGEMAESREIDLTINFRDLDPDRLTGLRMRERAMTVFDELIDNTSSKLDPIKDELLEGGGSQSLYELDREAWSALGRLRTPLQSAEPGRDAYLMNLAARGLARGRHLGIRQAIRRIPFARGLRDKEAQAASFKSALGDTTSAMRVYGYGRDLVRAMMGEELSAVALGDFLDLKRQTELLLPEENSKSETRNSNSRRFARVLGLTLHRAEAITASLADFEVDWRNTEAGKLHEVAEAIGPRLESLALDLETLRADDRRSRSNVNQLGPWWQLGAMPFIDFDAAFRRQFAPEVAIELSKKVEGKSWKRVPTWEEGSVRELAKPGTVVYLFRTITAAQENEVEAEISCREGVSIWLNGEIWVETRNQRSSSAQRHTMKLRPGQNNLLVKLVNRRHPHPFSFRIENGRVEGDVDALATEADKLQFLSRETKSTIDDAIRLLQPMLVRLADRTKGREGRAAGSDTRDLTAQLQRYVSRSLYHGIASAKGGKAPASEQFLPEATAAVFWTPTTDALDSFAWLDETRRDADASFCQTTGVVARALEAMKPEFASANRLSAKIPAGEKYSPRTDARRDISSRIALVSEQFRTLERAYDVREMERAVRELAAQEEWRSQGPEPRTRHPFEWQFIVGRLKTTGLRLTQDSSSGILSGTALLDLLDSPGAKQISREMDRRLTALQPAADLRPQLSEIRAQLAEIAGQMKPLEAEALAVIHAESPTMLELMAMAAEATRNLQARTREVVVEIAGADETVAFDRTRKLFLAQQQSDRLVRNVMNALRQDANGQNVLLAAGRERSRDVDSALEWLRLPAKLSGSAYEDALFAETPREQRHFLEDGAVNQGTLTNRFEALAGHFTALDQSGGSNLRAELRELEVEFEIRERLDREYDQLQRVAEMAKLSQTSELIAALEGELSGNGAMQRELDALTRNDAQDALTNLQRAALAEAEIRAMLEEEAVRQGETRPALSKSEIRSQKSETAAEVARLRKSASNLREGHLSLRAQHQQLRQRREEFERARQDFLEIELPAIGLRQPNLAQANESKNSPVANSAVKSALAMLQQTRKEAEAKVQAENVELTKLDFSDQLTALKSALTDQRAKIADSFQPAKSNSNPEFRVSDLPSAAEALRLFDSALTKLPSQHAGNVRLASQLYQHSNNLRNAAARLEATSEAALSADRQVLATTTQPDGKTRQELTALLQQFRDLVQTRFPATMQKAREIGASDARPNHDQAKKDAAAALALVPKSGANLLNLSHNLDQLGRHLREAGDEMKRATGAIRVQVESRAGKANSSAREMADQIRRVQNQVRSQKDKRARALNEMRPRGKRTLPEDEMKAKQQEADEAAKRAAELTRQFEQMTAEHKGQVAKTQAFVGQVRAAMTATEADGKLAQDLAGKFRDLAERFEENIAALQPRENSEAGRTAKRVAAEINAVTELAGRVEQLALRINPNVHTPSEAEMAARQADQALEKVTALLAEQSEIANGPQADDLLPQIEDARQADAAAHEQLASAEKRLRKLAELAALPDPDPNPKRARSAILAAADGQSRVTSPVTAAGGSLVRAALHEQRLGHPTNAGRLGELAKRVHELGASDLPLETERMRAAAKVSATAELAGQAEDMIRAQMAALRAFLFPEATVSVEARLAAAAEAERQALALAADPLSEREAEVSEQLARVLFQVQQRVPEETLMAQLDVAVAGARAAVERDFSEQLTVDSEQSEPETVPEPETSPTEPETSPTEPDTAPTQPENSPTEPENTQAQPENAPAEPDNAPAQPESSPTEPENTQAQPENAPAEPDTTPTQPESSPTEPENTQAQPENAPAEPDTTPTEPENSPTESENMEAQPENSPTEPENMAQPENAATEPDTAPTQPENSPTEPENMEAQPENAPAEPDTTPTEPENTPAEPDTAPAQPESSPTEPENTQAQPENAPAEPDNAPTQPENTPTESENMEAQPENAPAEPDNAPTQPENTPTEPENMEAQPENAPAEPDNAPAQPESSPTEPENTQAQPENAPAEPDNAPTQPENAPTEPENTQAQPENAPAVPENMAQPENAPAEPDTAPTQPENTPTEPENTQAQPENAPAEPDNAPAQPESSPTEPENMAQPENAPADPLDATALPENALDALPVAPELAEALQAVAETQAQALNAERNDTFYALPAVELDETLIERDSFSDDLDRLAALRDRNWNAFREEGEQELSLGNDDEIDGIYRDAIEAYFRVISREAAAPAEK